MRLQAATICAMLAALAQGAPVAKPASIYEDPKTATLPYAPGSLKAVEVRESIYEDPKTATLPYGINSLNVKEKRESIYEDPKTATLPYSPGSFDV